MYRTLSTLRERRAKGEKGFTLIELLVVVVILGVLIAIAIPLYLNYRKGANDASAQSDLKNAINVLEQCNADNGAYPTGFTTLGSAAATSSTVTGTCTGQKINLSNGTTLLYGVVGSGYKITDHNANGAPKYYCYNSTVGGSVKQDTAATSDATATC